MSLHLQTLATDDHAALANFIWTHNQRTDGRVRCLHAEQGDSAEAHLRELQALNGDDHPFIAAHAGGAWLGVIGAECDGMRAWVRGPLWTAEAGPGRVVPALLQQLIRRLPETGRFDAFWQADEADLLALAHAAGWREQALYHVMEAHAAGLTALRRDTHTTVQDAQAPQYAAAMVLHEQAFPATYMPPQALLASLDDDHRLLIATLDGRVAGYLYVQHRRADNDGYIDYLAVEESARRHGIGRALLDAALLWTLTERALPKVSLTVQQQRAPALGLYLAAGFHIVAHGAHMVFER